MIASDVITLAASRQDGARAAAAACIVATEGLCAVAVVEEAEVSAEAAAELAAHLAALGL